MKKSIGSFITLNRNAYLVLGLMLSLGVFVIVGWRTSAQVNYSQQEPPEQKSDANGDNIGEVQNPPVEPVTMVSTAACNGSIRFTNAPDVTAGDSPNDFSLGDFNNDTKPDIAVITRSGNTFLVAIRLGDGLGGFTTVADVGGVGLPRAIAVGDFNNDGKQDLAVVGSSGFLLPDKVYVRLGNGMGGFSGSTVLDVSGQSYAIAVKDINNDGKQDVIVSSTTVQSGPGGISVYLGDGLGGFGAAIRTTIGANPTSFSIGDFNADGKLDFASIHSNTGVYAVAVRLGDGTGSFGGTTEVIVGDSGSANIVPREIAIGDFNNDGKLDLATVNSGSTGSSLSIRLGNGLGAFSGTDIPLSESPLDIAVGDFNTDGKLDIAIGNDADSRTISIALGDGAGSFGGVTNVVTDSSTIIAVADLNNDGVPDLVADGENSTSNPRVVSIRLGGCVATPPHNTCSFSNGGLNPQLSSESGVAAPAGFFWSEVQHNTGNTTEVNNFAGLSSRDGFFRLADDFAIGQPCTLASVVFYAYLNGAPATPSPFTGYTLQIWNGRPGDAGASVIVGDTTTNRLASSVDSTYFRIFNSAVPPPGTATTTANKIWANTVTINTTLTAGTYWLDWSSTVTGGAAHFQPSKTLPGSRGAFNDNARQQTVSTGVWRDALDRGKPSSAPDYIQDFPFDVTGIGGGGTPTPTPTPTPALATVDGRVLTSDGRGLRNATVSMTSSQGVIRTSTTSSFGFFSFDNVSTGQMYVFRISSRLFRFQPRTVQVNGNLTLADFVGLE